jgi:hypothetical protein
MSTGPQCFRPPSNFLPQHNWAKYIEKSNPNSERLT